MSDFLEIDFCKSRALRIARRFDVSDGIISDQLAGATGLGCNFPISHRASTAPGFVLSRISKQSGKKVSDLLASINESSPGNPGPTAWLSAAPDRFMSGAAVLPFPAAQAIVTPTLLGEDAEIAQTFQAIGLGGSTGFRTTVVLPPGDLEYIDPNRLADHNTRWYYGCVSSDNELEAYRLTYATVNTVTGTRDVYIWQGVAGQGTSVTLNALNNWEHHVGVSVVGTPVALSEHDIRVKTPPVAAYTGPLPGTIGSNGPDQIDRKFSYPFMGALTNPGFNNSASPVFTLTGTRPTLTVFKQEEFDTAFGGFSIFTINGSPISFQSTTLPADQYASPSNLDFDFTGAGATSFFDSGFFGDPMGASQGMLYGPVNQAGQSDVDADTISLAFQIRAADQVPAQPTASFTINLPKVAGFLNWFECVVTVYSRHVGVLT